ncbi:GNAT family N-acetyltransferase [Enterococcus bulliens]
MELKIRLATASDLDAIDQLIQDAIISMATKGLPQWQNGYGPTREQFIKEIAQKQVYVGDYQQTLAAVASVIPGIDPVYTKVQGAFHQDSLTEYQSIHRFAINQRLEVKGLGKKWLSLLLQLILDQNGRDIRIDTHPLNIGMQKVILANAFVYCGTIQFPIPDGQRYVYQYFKESLEKTCH